MPTRPSRATAKKNYAEDDNDDDDDDDDDDDTKVMTTCATDDVAVVASALTKATKKKTTTRSMKEKKAVVVVVDEDEKAVEIKASTTLEEEEEEEEVVATSTSGSTIANIIYSHFDTHQHNGGSAYAAASALHRDLLSTSSVSNGEYEISNTTNKEVSNVIITCLDSTMSAILRLSGTKGGGGGSNSGGGGSKNKGNECWMESTTSTLELIVAFAFLHNPSPTGAGGGDGGTSSLPLAIIERATRYASLLDVDNGRVVACNLLKMMITQLLSTSTTATAGAATKSKSALRKGGKKSKKENDNTNNATNDEGGGGGATAASPWEIECLYRATVALVSRITDKISRVRSAAIDACGPLLSLLVSTSPSGNKFFSHRTMSLDTTTVNVFAMTMNSLFQKLMWLVRNDTSASNRALIVCILPPSAIAIGIDEDKDEDNNDVAISAIIERIKDVDVRVREAALDTIRMNVHDFVIDLTEDMRVEILRMGLTKRCMATHVKTVQLLCTNWLKLTRFDPIALLEYLNPVLNESICEEVSRVLIRIASTIDLEDGPSDRGVELVREHFGGPEIRSLIHMVLKRRNIIVADSSEGVAAANNGVVDGNFVNGGLTPSMAIFLRVRCEVSSSSSDVVTDIITDVPTLCNILNTHIDKLIDFNSDDEIYDEMDEDEAAAHEDAQAFVCLQLMHMARSSELHREEGSRRHFITIMRRIMARLATPDDLVEACVKAMASAHDKESQFLQTISEILADVEDDDTFHNKDLDPRALVIVRQMRIIAILSIVLESVSGNVTSHPILDTFFQHLSPAITSKNAIVREHGVICLSKFCLLSGEDKVLNEFRPLLLTIAGSVEERVEVRAQAALALCDLALIHEGMLLMEEDTTAVVHNARNPSSSTMPSFKGMLLEMLGHSKPGIVIIAAEIAAKLLLARRITDPTIIAWLVLIYFDSSLMNHDDEYADNGGAEEAAKKVGSPVRLQQLLSIFFPTYSMSSLDANDDMMSSIGPVLAILNQKLTGLKETDAKVKTFPIAKMVEYISYNVDLADKKKNEDTKKNESFGTKKCDETTTVIDSEQTVTNCNSTTEEDVTVVIEASSILLAAIEISEFLSEDCDTAPIFFVRALAKILASARIDVETEDKELLRRLKSSVCEAEYANDDGPTVKSIKKLVSLLANVNDEEDAPSDNVAGQVDKEENMSDNDHNDKADDSISLRDIVRVEKENHSLCGAVEEFDVTKIMEHEQRTSPPSLQRVSLADVN